MCSSCTAPDCGHAQIGDGAASVRVRQTRAQSHFSCCRVLLLGLVAATAHCGANVPAQPSRPVEFVFRLEAGPDGWEAGFSNYPAGQENAMELTADYRQLPAVLGLNRSALFISANNRSDDLVMFFRRRVTGLEPTARYTVGFEIEFATDAPRGCGGIGGSPGESVYVKAGASPMEPLARPGALGQMVLNVDKGNQSQGGREAAVLGTIENTVPCQQEPDGSIVRRWELKTLRSSGLVHAEADLSGGVWLIVGTDSGFEGRTELYYTRIRATFNPE